MERVFLDPDYRGPLPPKDKPYCCRCQKVININRKAALRCSTDESSMDVWLDENGVEWIGPDCAAQIGLTTKA